MMNKTLFGLAAAAGLWVSITASVLAEGDIPQRRAQHVIVISFDGGKPAVINESEMPVFKRLAAEGSHTWVANTIFPPKTLPSHTSMTTGVGPDKHQILWNDWMPIRGLVKVPTMFSLAKDAGRSTAMFVGKVKFRHLWLKDSVDEFNFGGAQDGSPVPANQDKAVVPAQTVAKEAAAYIVAKKPDLCFIHFPDGDSAGHKSGWGSPEQKEAFKVCDQALSQIVKAVKEAGIADSTVMILSADHGGHEKNHSENIPDDMNIPWIAWGAGVSAAHEIQGPVTTFDTAATALWLLGVPVPASFDGKPVKEAFAPVAVKAKAP
jgi:predicted AlkP superfamily pyrophosphatase or phosphodiesterase